MKNYSHFSVNEFVLDEFFVGWVTAPDEYSNAFWNQFLADNPHKSGEVEEAKTILRSLSFLQYKLPEHEIASLWSRVRSFEHMPRESKGISRFSAGVFYRAAAAVVLLTSFVFIYFTLQHNAYITYHTAYGETKTIQLPDNSTVILNSNSTLKLPSAWERGAARTVWLEGEAFFSVVHLSNNQSFKVHTADDNVAVEVLGTTFNVYHRTEETKVVLNTGKIRLHLPEESAAPTITMKPGEFVEYKQKTFSKRVVNPEIYSAWTEKKLILDHTSLREMVDMLRDNYGVEVKVAADTLLNQTVSGSMPLADIETLVHQIAQTFQLKVERQKNTYLMYE